jgi:hypothetical protein
LDRLKERHLGLEKLAAEVSKVEGLAISPQDLIGILKNNSRAGAYLLAAAKMDDDYKKNLLPTDFTGWEEVGKCFGDFSASEQDCIKQPDYPEVELPPFIKHALIKIVKKSESRR